jgi:hypothetical protein
VQLIAQANNLNSKLLGLLLGSVNWELSIVKINSKALPPMWCIKICLEQENKMTMCLARYVVSVMKLLAFLTVAMASSIAHAEMYRCTAANGGVAFSDRPCTNSRQEAVDMKYKSDRAKQSRPATEELNTPAISAPKPESTSAESASTPPTARVIPLEDRLAAICVDVYRKHLAYPNGVQIKGRTLERSLSEMHIVVNVRTITNPATPTNIDPIFLTEKFICVTDFGLGLNQRSTDFFVARHKKGQRL